MPAPDMPNFYAAVYHLVAQIPPGRVTTYGQVARWLGHPSAARAVGYALHALPANSDLPWQRVINAAGRISSRSDRHYEAIQRTLLEAEGVRFDRYDHVDLSTFGWRGPSEHQETQQHQQADQQQEDGDVPAQEPDVQTPRQHGAQLSSDDDAGPSIQQRPGQEPALLAQRSQKRTIQARQRRRQARDKNHRHG